MTKDIFPPNLYGAYFHLFSSFFPLFPYFFSLFSYVFPLPSFLISFPSFSTLFPSFSPSSFVSHPDFSCPFLKSLIFFPTLMSLIWQFIYPQVGGGEEYDFLGKYIPLHFSGHIKQVPNYLVDILVFLAVRTQKMAGNGTSASRPKWKSSLSWVTAIIPNAWRPQ